MDSRNYGVKLPIPAQLPGRWECQLCGLKFLSEASKDKHMAKDCIPSSKFLKDRLKDSIPSSEPYKLPNPSSQPLKPLLPYYDPKKPPVSNIVSTSETQEQTPHSSKDHPPLRPITTGHSNSTYPPVHLNFHQQTAELTCIQDACKEEKQQKKILGRQPATKSRNSSSSEHMEDTIHSPLLVESHYQVFTQMKPPPKPSNKAPELTNPQREEEEIYTNLGYSADNLRLMQEVKDLKVTNEKLRVENKELEKRNSKSDGIIDDFSLKNKQLKEKLAKLEILLNYSQDLKGIENVYENLPNPNIPLPYTKKK